LRVPTTLLTAITLLVVAAPTHASALRLLPAESTTLSAAKSAPRACDARVFRSGARGIARHTWRAPMSGFVTTRLTAKRRDWDLAVFDARSRNLLTASQGFSSSEIAQTWVMAGQRLIVQGCRQKGRSKRAQTRVQLFDVAPPNPKATPQMLEVTTRNEADLYRLENLGVDVTHQVHDGKADVIVAGAKQRGLLDKAGFKYDVEIADLAQHYAESREADLAFARRVKGRSSLPSGRTTYRSLADYQAELKALATQHPSLVKPVELPKKTLEGRTIEGVEIASNVRRPEDGRPVYFVVAVHHAREWPAGEAAMELAHTLVQEYGTNPRVTSVLDKTRVVIVPLINVDGFVSSRGATDPADTTWYGDNDDVRFLGPNLYTGEAATGIGAYRRKTCRGTLPVGAPCALQYGVDPNRNYATGWGAMGASTSPHDQTYRGTGPWSEPETQAVHEYSQTRQVTNIITIHNVAALVLRPPGREALGLAPDEERMKEIGDAMGKTTGYRSQYGWQLYDTSGTTEDWNYAAQGAYGYTIEIGPGDDPSAATGTPDNYDPDSAFHMPYEKGFVRQWDGWIPEKHGGLKDALLIGAEAAANPADHSVIEGEAPAGRVLRAKKQFVTKTETVCTVLTGGTPVYFTSGPLNPATENGFCLAETDPIEIDDGLETEMVVPSSGEVKWHVNPSTRPFERRKEIPAGEPARVGEPTTYGPQPGEEKDSYVLEQDQFPFPGDYDFIREIVAEETGQQLPEHPTLPPGAYSDPQPEHTYERKFTLSDARDELRFALEWGVPAEDYDLYIYYDGVQVGNSGNPAGLSEAATIANAQPGEYTIHIVDYASAAPPDWTLTVEQFDRPAPEIIENKEYWTVTCEMPDGTVLSTRDIFVDRGDRVQVEFGKGCQKPKKPKGK
jgi:hypothetical protein